ncbi:hypothetical protein NDU88_008029 [Pleurodeles waltl]|uniref:Uncharacterized protein n=1 Tax=Pleurodeles waltl TaxID=8319 RepID=A0AAV7NXY2_PLEWA|nr:hypothetical protein NDU88_008029 [Pleurodeles waltl]
MLRPELRRIPHRIDASLSQNSPTSCERNRRSASCAEEIPPHYPPIDATAVTSSRMPRISTYRPWASLEPTSQRGFKPTCQNSTQSPCHVEKNRCIVCVCPENRCTPTFFHASPPLQSSCV